MCACVCACVYVTNSMLNYCRNKIANAMLWTQINWINLLPTSFPVMAVVVMVPFDRSNQKRLKVILIDRPTDQPTNTIYTNTFFIKSQEPSIWLELGIKSKLMCYTVQHNTAQHNIGDSLNLILGLKKQQQILPKRNPVYWKCAEHDLAFFPLLFASFCVHRNQSIYTYCECEPKCGDKTNVNVYC